MSGWQLVLHQTRFPRFLSTLPIHFKWIPATRLLSIWADATDAKQQQKVSFVFSALFPPFLSFASSWIFWENSPFQRFPDRGDAIEHQPFVRLFVAFVSRAEFIKRKETKKNEVEKSRERRLWLTNEKWICLSWEFSSCASTLVRLLGFPVFLNDSNRFSWENIKFPFAALIRQLTTLPPWTCRSFSSKRFFKDLFVCMTPSQEGARKTLWH